MKEDVRRPREIIEVCHKNVVTPVNYRHDLDTLHKYQELRYMKENYVMRQRDCNLIMG